MGKYDPLLEYLGERTNTYMTMTFGDIEDRVGPLPAAARNRRAWWMNGSKVEAWQAAGWSVGSLDRVAETVVFVRLATENAAARSTLASYPAPGGAARPNSPRHEQAFPASKDPSTAGTEDSNSVSPPETIAATSRPHYDVRYGATGYAPIIATFGALAIPGIIVLFTERPKSEPSMAPLFTLAAGLLIVAMMGGLTGSIGMAAIGAERESTPNLPPAITYVALPASLSIVSMLAAFEVLAAIYLPHSKTLFAIITGMVGVGAVFFTALAIGDSWHTAPVDPSVREEWLKSEWLKTQAHTYKATNLVTITALIPVIAATILRAFSVDITPTSGFINWIIGVGLAIVTAGTAVGMLRTVHALDKVDRGFHKAEAFGVPLVLAFYICALLVFLP
jgi:hypothetical protein